MSEIIKASLNDTDAVYDITQTTIRAVYPHYYPAGAVEFFSQHHSKEKIVCDIETGCVWLVLDENGSPAGTVTVNDNEINRLFVLPEHQGKGFGRMLMEFAENLISQKFSTAELSASLSAKSIYLRNGYSEVSYNIIDSPNGDKLCYDYMIKHLDSKGGSD